MAIGTRAHVVLMQFLVEAVMQSSLGGLLGIALAYALCGSLAARFRAPFEFNPVINAVAFPFSAAVGVFLGIMPAQCQSRCVATRMHGPEASSPSKQGSDGH